MKKTLLCAVALIATAGVAPVLAQTAPATHPMTHAEPVTRAAMLQKLQQHFAMIDANHDGFATKEEMQAARATMHKRLEQRMEKRGEARFDRMDTNHDGSISRQEFDSAHEKMAGHMGNRHGKRGMHAMHAGMMGHMFAMADSDNDGRVSLQEASAAAAAHFDKADANHDGTLTPDEMRAAHKAMRAKSGRS